MEADSGSSATLSPCLSMITPPWKRNVPYSLHLEVKTDAVRSSDKSRESGVSLNHHPSLIHSPSSGKPQANGLSMESASRSISHLQNTPRAWVWNSFWGPLTYRGIACPASILDGLLKSKKLFSRPLLNGIPHPSAEGGFAVCHSCQ